MGNSLLRLHGGMSSLKTSSLQKVHALFPSPQGGNDYEIFEDARTIGRRVTNPEDTRRQLEELFAPKHLD